jgi:hypothetical protein
MKFFKKKTLKEKGSTGQGEGDKRVWMNRRSNGDWADRAEDEEKTRVGTAEAVAGVA